MSQKRSKKCENLTTQDQLVTSIHRGGEALEGIRAPRPRLLKRRNARGVCKTKSSMLLQRREERFASAIPAFEGSRTEMMRVAMCLVEQLAQHTCSGLYATSPCRLDVYISFSSIEGAARQPVCTVSSCQESEEVKIKRSKNQKKTLSYYFLRRGSLPELPSPQWGKIPSTILVRMPRRDHRDIILMRPHIASVKSPCSAKVLQKDQKILICLVHLSMSDLNFFFRSPDSRSHPNVYS